MRRPSSVLITTVIAFILAGCSSLLAYNYLKKFNRKPLQGVAVASAATEIQVGTKLDVTNIKLVAWPKESLPAGSHQEARGLVGRIAVRPMTVGDIVTEQKLMPLTVAGKGGLMTYIVPQGHRAVTVAVNEVAGVAGFITPNSRVDIVLTSALPGDKEENMSKIILQNVPVLASGQVTEQKEGKPTVVPTVTLDLLPDDAEKIIVGARKGTLQLLLRNVIDSAAVTTRGATITTLLGHRGDGALPAKAAALRREAKAIAPLPLQAKCYVEIIRGGSKSTREFTAE